MPKKVRNMRYPCKIQTIKGCRCSGAPTKRVVRLFIKCQPVNVYWVTCFIKQAYSRPGILPGRGLATLPGVRVMIITLLTCLVKKILLTMPFVEEALPNKIDVTSKANESLRKRVYTIGNMLWSYKRLTSLFIANKPSFL